MSRHNQSNQNQPAQSAAYIRRAEILETIQTHLTDSANIYLNDVRVYFFSCELLSHIDAFFAAGSLNHSRNQLASLKTMIQADADNLALDIYESAENICFPITTYQCAYLMTAIYNLNERHDFSTETVKLFTMLSYYYLKTNQIGAFKVKEYDSQDETQQNQIPDQNEIRYSVQFFYHLCKLLKNTIYRDYFFDLNNIDRFNLKIISLFSVLGNALEKRPVNLNMNPNAQDIAQTILALGYLAQCGLTYDVRDTIGHLLCALVLKEKPTSKAQDISNTILALGYLAQRGKTYEISQFMRDIFLLLPYYFELNEQQISNIFLGLGYLAQQGKIYPIPQKTITFLLSKLLNLNPGPQDIANTFFSLGLMVQQSRYLDGYRNILYPIVRDLFNKFMQLGNQSKATEISQILIVHFRLKYFLDVTLIDDVGDLNKLNETQNDIKPHPNTFQRLTENILQEMGVTILLEQLVCGYFVDIFLPNEKMIIEFDGEKHYDVNNNLRLEDQLRDELLQKAGYKVIRIKNEELKGNNDKEKLREKLHVILSKTKSAPEKTSAATAAVSVASNCASFIASCGHSKTDKNQTAIASLRFSN